MSPTGQMTIEKPQANPRDDTMVPLEDILLLLEKHPTGISSKDAAKRLGVRQRSLANRLSKQFLCGGPVDREVRRVYIGDGKRAHYDEYLWKLRSGPAHLWRRNHLPLASQRMRRRCRYPRASPSS
jgi:hypothetical protein